jgi:hypothetical protein
MVSVRAGADRLEVARIAAAATLSVDDVVALVPGRGGIWSTTWADGSVLGVLCVADGAGAWDVRVHVIALWVPLAVLSAAVRVAVLDGLEAAGVAVARVDVVIADVVAEGSLLEELR